MRLRRGRIHRATRRRAYFNDEIVQMRLADHPLMGHEQIDRPLQAILPHPRLDDSLRTKRSPLRFEQRPYVVGLIHDTPSERGIFGACSAQ
jgi:hypothetical protein